MKTPLMELIEWVKKEPYMIDRTSVFTKATELLEKEREVIEKAYDDCAHSFFSGVSYKNGSDYYTKTFTNESK